MKHLSRPISRLALACALSACLSACLSGGEDKAAGGLAVEEDAVHGPSIVFNPLELPIPDVPFPNDISLRTAADTFSGLAWNVSPEQPTEHRARIRRLINQVDGFGPYAPILVPFDGPLDLKTVHNTTVMVVNIEEGHPRFGERAALDLGQGYFPIAGRPGGWFGQDPNGELADILLSADNVVVVDGEETRPTWYEAETNTLIVRPIIPLAQGARHAVLITRDVMGVAHDAEGPMMAPVRSPFPYKAHPAQAPFIRKALDVAGVAPGRLAFGWTYTTADVTRPLITLREGIYGRGALARVADLVEPTLASVRDTGIFHDTGGKFDEDPRDTPFILQGEFLTDLLSIIGQVQGDSNFNLTFPNVDYFVFGSVNTPDFRRGERNDFAINFKTGEGPIGVQEVPFVVSVPKTTERFKPPFPVMFYFHGTGTSRMESLAIADVMSRQGIAVVAFDEVGHGPLFPDIPTLLEQNPEFVPLVPILQRLLANLLVPDRANEVAAMDFDDAVQVFYDVGLFAELGVYGRNTDENGDGFLDTAEGFFFADPFRQCSSFWQDTSDLMQLVKVIRNLDPSKVPPRLDDPAGASAEVLQKSLLAGDFNADGILDIGGPGVPLSVAGTSLGGFHAVLAAALEPEITTATPIVAGGGFADIMIRSDLRSITERIFLDVLGTVVVGCPAEDGRVHLSQGNDADRCRALDEAAGTHFAFSSALEPGAKVELTNLKNGEVGVAEVNEAGGFSVAVETDKGDPIRLRLPDGETHEMAAAFEGHGLVRNTPDLRKAVAVQQHVFDRCDPINFARHLFWEPLDGHPTTNTLFYYAIGDDTVPVSTGVNLALAAGALGYRQSDWAPRGEALIRAGVLDNAHYDVDDVLGDNPPDQPALGPFPPVRTPTGLSTARFGDVAGKHEYIAGYQRDGFDHGKYHQHHLAIYHRCQGRVVYDEDPTCLQSADCEVLGHVNDLPECAAP